MELSPVIVIVQIDGIGKDLADKIDEFAETGSLKLLTDLENEFPHGVLALLRVPGLGPKKAATLHKQLGIASLDMLRDACDRLVPAWPWLPCNTKGASQAMRRPEPPTATRISPPSMTRVARPTVKVASAGFADPT